MRVHCSSKVSGVSSSAALSLYLHLQVADFAVLTQQFEERMRSSGPGLPTVQLPDGHERLKTFQEDVDALSKQREHLRLAEQLFDMDVTSYPALSKVRSCNMIVQVSNEAFTFMLLSVGKLSKLLRRHSAGMGSTSNKQLMFATYLSMPSG